MFSFGDMARATGMAQANPRRAALLTMALLLTAGVVAAGVLLRGGASDASVSAGEPDSQAGVAGDQSPRAAHKEAPPRRAPSELGFWSKQRGLIGKDYPDSERGGRILLTTNGGRGFEVVLRTKSGIESIDTAGTQDAWVVTKGEEGRKRLLLHSGDGGRSWERVSADPPLRPSFSTARDGMGIKYPHDGTLDSKRALITHDGGKSWSRATSPCSARRIGGSVVTGAKVATATPSNALAVCVGEGSTGMQPKEIYRTEDGGQTWEKVTDDGSCDGPTGICRAGSAGVLTLDESGAGGLTTGYYAYLTWDLGETWSHRRTGDGPNFSTLVLQPVSQRAVVALIYGGRSEYRLIVTSDRGEHWRVVRRWHPRRRG